MNSLTKRLLSNYDQSMFIEGISAKRLATRFGELSQIGRLTSGGVSRFGYTKEEQAAFSLAKSWLKEAGAEIEIDDVGNLIGHIKGQSNKKTFASGSHLDSVPNGGHFDGTVGVVTAIEVAQAWKDKGIVPAYDYDIIIFREEEGSQFNTGVLGSSAFMGLQSKEAFIDVTGVSSGLSFEKILEKNDLSVEQFFKAKKNRNYTLYLETHIEQGKVLEHTNQSVGVVSGITGLANYVFTFTGESNHAGSTPMNDRKDPWIPASRFIYEVSKLPQKVSDTAVATVGQVNVYPNGSNVIAESVTITVDIRDIDLDQRVELEQLIINQAIALSEEYETSIQYKRTNNVKPVLMDEILQNDLKEILYELTQKPVTTLPSGAGHDAMNLANAYPTAMLFIKSYKGISHHPDEWSDLSDIILGILVSKKFIEKRMELESAVSFI